MTRTTERDRLEDVLSQDMRLVNARSGVLGASEATPARRETPITVALSAAVFLVAGTTPVVTL